VGSGESWRSGACCRAVFAVMRSHASRGVSPSFTGLAYLTFDVLRAAGRGSEIPRYGECLNDLVLKANIIPGREPYDPVGWRDDGEVDTRGWPDEAVEVLLRDTGESSSSVKGPGVAL
jgi:hypothetical protein